MVNKKIQQRLWAENAAGRGDLWVRRPEKPREPEVPAGQVEAFKALEEEIKKCARCKLSESRRHTVPGEGHMSPELVFIGEAPGRDEDLTGRPFVGRAGQLLTKMIAAMGLTREQVFIGNVLKCRPPRNRDPQPEEIACCRSYLMRQLALLKPRVVVSLGSYATRWLLQENVSITRIRGTLMEKENFIIMPTFHPSYLLRSPHEKAKVWLDLQQVMKLLGLPMPAR